MGQNHNKAYLNQQLLHSVYEETLSNKYFTHTKGFGYRKTNIKSTKHHNISQFVKNNACTFERGQKGIMKKQFQTQTYPYSCIGLIVVSYKDRYTFGTGCLIGPNLVLTTASNVYQKDTDEHPEAIRFILNINQGEGDVYRIKKDIKIPQKYVEEATGSHTYNYAILQVQCQQPFQDQNTTQYGQNTNETLNKSCFPGLSYGYLGINTKFSGMQKIYIYGYSMDVSDKNELRFTLRGQKIDKIMCKNGSIGYKMQSSEREYGSPILVRRNQYYHIVGIHICGKKDLSTGLQLDQTIRTSINHWITVKQGRMDLSGKELNSKALTLLSSKDWRNLTMLNLDNNNLVCSGFIVLTKSVWPVLRQLHVCNNGTVKLEFDPSSLINLQVLYLSKNQIKDIVILSELPILRVLQLSDNRIEDFSELIPLKYLQRLYLNGNKLTRIPHEIERWTQLKKFELSRNYLQSIPEELMKLRKLSVISLDQNSSKFQKNQIIRKLQSNNVEVILK